MARRRLAWGIVALALAVAPLLASIAQATTIADLARVTAKAAIVVDNETGQVLFARNPNLKLPPASTTKILTATIALRSGALNQGLRVSRNASKAQPSKIWLQPGWTLSVRDLVYAILLRSANDASIVLAEGLSGSVARFARMMNTTAHALDATRSNFVNPSGLPARGHYSTALDLTKIMKHALETPHMRKILSVRSATIRPRSGSAKRIALRSTNRLLGHKHLEVIGKTGYTRRAKRCFVGAASAGGREILVAVLGSTNLWPDIEILINYGLKRPEPLPEWSKEVGWRHSAAPAPKVELRTETGDEQPPAFRYHVQLASFRSETRAQMLRKQVARLGYNVTVDHIRGSRTMYRVMVRDLETRAAARRVARTLAKEFRVEPLIVAVRA